MGAAGFRAGHIDVPGASSRFVLSSAITPTPMRQLLRITATFALALVFSAGVAFGQQNTANITQSGPDGGYGDAIVDQDGSDLTATIEQLAARDNEDGNYAEISQTDNGSSNEAYIDQGGDKNIAEITQVGGSGNYAEITGQNAFSNNGKAFQVNGTKNSDIFIDMNGGGNFTFFSESVARARQESQSNSEIDIDISHGGVGADVDAVQKNGSSNTMDLDLTGSGNTVDVLQEDGSVYEAVVTQNAPGRRSTGDLTVRIDQLNGSSHYVNVTQSGNGHTADITQKGGTRHFAEVTQSN
jgi:hypothetical protein